MIVERQGDILKSHCTYLCHASGTLGPLLGTINYHQLPRHQFITDVFCQIKFKGWEHQTIDKALRETLTALHNRAEEEHSSVAIPYLFSCGPAGGDWEMVLELLKELFDGPNQPLLEIWHPL